MIEVTILPRELLVAGHARAAPPGQDIVCAAVSALTETLAAALDALTEDKVNIEKQSGLFRLRYGNLSREAQILVDSFFVGICGIADSYPEYVKIS